MEEELHRIVIVGGGAGGLELATRLGNKLGRRRKAAVTLIDGKRAHLWKPLLHEVAAGSMDLGLNEVDYLAQAFWHGFIYRAGDMTGIDRARRVVEVAPVIDEEGRQVTPARAFGYDTLVIAIGSLTNDFGTPGVKQHAIALETADEAARFHRRLVNACIRAHAQAEPLRPEQLQLAIIGAGATGTELAAELHKTTRQLVAYGLDRIDPDMDIKINLIEAAPRILPQLPERLAKAAVGLLEGLKVRIHTGAPVAEVLENGVRLANGTRIPAELSATEVAEAQRLSLRTFETLECEGMARVDLFLDKHRKLWVNEINTIPGFTRISMYPKLMQASGVAPRELVSRLIDDARARGKTKSGRKTST